MLRMSTFFFTCLFGSISVFAQVESVRSGAWEDPETWSTGEIPELADDVVVKHFVNYNSSLQFLYGSLTIAPQGELCGNFGITINGGGKLNVEGVLKTSDILVLDSAFNSGIIFAKEHVDVRAAFKNTGSMSIGLPFECGQQEAMTDSLTIDIEIYKSCDRFGGCGINVNSTVQGGLAPYHYEWSNGNEGEGEGYSRIEYCEFGWQQVIVTDANGLATTKKFFIDRFVTITYDQIVDPSCATCNDGKIEPSFTGDNPPFTTRWLLPNGQDDTSRVLNNAEAGEYILAVIDNHGCFEVDTINLKAVTGILDAGLVNEFTIMPNPSNGIMSVSYHLNSKSFARFDIIDLNGKRVASETLQNSSGILRLELDLPAGLYVGNLITSDRTIASENIVITK